MENMVALTTLLQLTENALEMRAEAGVIAKGTCLAELAMIESLAQTQYEQTFRYEETGRHQTPPVLEYRACFFSVKMEAQFDPMFPPSQRDIIACLHRVKDELILTVEHVPAHRTQ